MTPTAAWPLTAGEHSPARILPRWTAPAPTWPATWPRTLWPRAWLSAARRQIAYCIGLAEPVSVLATSMGTGQVDDETLTKAVREVFDLRPYFIIKRLNLKRPIYQMTTNYGHSGREKPELAWE